MDGLSLASFAGLALGLVLKLAGLTTIQAYVRLGSHVFRWPEDAAHFGGVARDGAPEDPRVERAQAALRNDSENHPAMIAASIAWISLGAEARVVAPVFAVYLLARVLHGVFLVLPRQPLRNRCYVVGQLVMLSVAVDAARRGLALL